MKAGCASKPERLVLFSASRKGFDPPERRIWHQRQAPAQADREPERGLDACPSFGSLKTEEKTERQCGQFVGPPSGDPAELSVNFAVGTPCRQQHGYRPSSTFVRCRFGQISKDASST